MDEQQHPIEGLMRTAMESIQEMMSVNSVVGEPVETPDGNVIIPVSRVSCGFGAGGSEFELTGKDNGSNANRPASPAFGGGSGAGMSVKPVGFLIAGKGKVRMLPVDGHALLDRLMDLTPELISQIQGMFNQPKDNRPELD